MPPTSTPSGPDRPFGRASAALAILTAVNLLNYLDRYVLSAVLPWIESSFLLTDSQSGFLGSMFMLLYLMGAPFAGYFGDRRSRKILVAGGVFLWSLATIGSGMVSSYNQLLVMRALVGIGERGSEVPVLCVEMEPGCVWSDSVQDALVALAAETKWDGLVQRFLPNDRFPTDARHNSKIRREDLKVWATQQCGDLVTSIAAA